MAGAILSAADQAHLHEGRNGIHRSTNVIEFALGQFSGAQFRSGPCFLRCPQLAQHHFHAIVMTAYGNLDAAVRAPRLGARDFIQKSPREAELATILQRECEKLCNTGASDAARLRAQVKLARLSPREYEVVRALARDQASKSIVYELDLSIRTVEIHRYKAMDRLGCRNFVELMTIALHGIFSLQKMASSIRLLVRLGGGVRCHRKR